MMNKYISRIGAVCCIAMAALLFTACNDFLDKLPDERAELNSNQKITQLLVSAYPDGTNNFLLEMMSDNMLDNGRSYSGPIISEEVYRMKDPTEESMDTPYYVWNHYYSSVATCNEALNGIKELGNPESLRAATAEAKLVRAFSMFRLACTFCMAWNPEKADEYLGLPYPTEPEQDVNTQYERGTLRQLYENINKDIEEALPDIVLAAQSYKTPKYHFNVKAAYAFACRFNLYYMKYDKAIKYASEVLGSAPKMVMRDYEPYRNLGRTDFGNRWIRSDEDANLMIVESNSWSGYYTSGNSRNRFNHNSTIASYETYWVDGPWGGGSDANSIIYANKIYGAAAGCSFPSYEYQYEVTDKATGNGYLHIFDTVFTGDITILERAEAYALSGDLEKAVADMNIWMETHCKDKYTNGELVCPAPATQTVADIVAFVEKKDYAKRNPGGRLDRSMRKRMHPQGFTVNAGQQEDVLQLLLHMKRLEFLFQGLRFNDIKRYGIEYVHPVSGEDPIYFIAGDLRGAIQLPQTVITAGLEGNPRMTKEEIASYVAATEHEYTDADENN